MKKFLAAFFVLAIVIMMLGCQKNSPTTPATTDTPTPNTTATEQVVMTQTAIALQTAGLTAQETATAEAQLTANAQATLNVQETSTAAVQQTANAQATGTMQAQQTATMQAQETANAIVTYTPQPTTTHTVADNVSGTLTLPASQQGKFYWVAVYIGQIGAWTATDIGICPSGTSVPFSLYVPAGSGYSIVALVNATGPDVLGNICGSDGPPRPGDYMGQNGSTVWPTPGPSFSAPQSGINIQMSTAPANLQGTITLPSPQPGKIIAIEVSSDTKGNGSGGNMQFTFYDVLGSSATYNYSVCAVFPGNYYVYGFVDVDNNSQIGNDIYNSSTPAGDYLGYYGGSGVNPPGSLTTINYSSINYLNFPLATE